MKRSNFVHLLLIFCLGFLLTAPCAQVALAQQGPGTLVVFNRTGGPVDVLAWEFNGKYWAWTPIMRIPPGYRNQVGNVRAGEVFRAFKYVNRSTEDHRVNTPGPGPDMWNVR